MIGDTWGHTGNYLQRGIAHGIVRGILARVQGGNFSRGFMSAFASVQFGRFSQALRDTGNAVKAVFHALVGGTVSLISGGKFGNGAVSAAVVYLFNDMANYILKQSRGRHSIADSMTDKGLVASGKAGHSWLCLQRDLADGCANASLVSGIASASIPVPQTKLVLVATSAEFAGAATFFNDVSANEDMLGMTRDTFLSAMMPPGYMGTMTEELIKLYINIRGN